MPPAPRSTTRALVGVPDLLPLASRGEADAIIEGCLQLRRDPACDGAAR